MRQENEIDEFDYQREDNLIKSIINDKPKKKGKLIDIIGADEKEKLEI